MEKKILTDRKKMFLSSFFLKGGRIGWKSNALFAGRWKAMGPGGCIELANSLFENWHGKASSVRSSIHEHSVDPIDDKLKKIKSIKTLRNWYDTRSKPSLFFVSKKSPNCQIVEKQKTLRTGSNYHPNRQRAIQANRKSQQKIFNSKKIVKILPIFLFFEFTISKIPIFVIKVQNKFVNIALLWRTLVDALREEINCHLKT